MKNKSKTVAPKGSSGAKMSGVRGCNRPNTGGGQMTTTGSSVQAVRSHSKSATSKRN